MVIFEALSQETFEQFIQALESAGVQIDPFVEGGLVRGWTYYVGYEGMKASQLPAGCRFSDVLERYQLQLLAIGRFPLLRASSAKVNLRKSERWSIQNASDLSTVAEIPILKAPKLFGERRGLTVVYRWKSNGANAFVDNGARIQFCTTSKSTVRAVVTHCSRRGWSEVIMELPKLVAATFRKMGASSFRRIDEMSAPGRKRGNTSRITPGVGQYRRPRPNGIG
jgi:hypothetical protein